jgi:hypothetical protein
MSDFNQSKFISTFVSAFNKTFTGEIHQWFEAKNYIISRLAAEGYLDLIINSNINSQSNSINSGSTTSQDDSKSTTSTELSRRGKCWGFIRTMLSGNAIAYANSLNTNDPLVLWKGLLSKYLIL